MDARQHDTSWKNPGKGLWHAESYVSKKTSKFYSPPNVLFYKNVSFKILEILKFVVHITLFKSDNIQTVTVYSAKHSKQKKEAVLSYQEHLSDIL